MSNNNNNLPAVASLSAEELIALTGQSVKSGPAFPRLTVNKDVGEDEDKPLPIGKFCLKQSGVAVYGKPVTFRPFINAFQYGVYDSDTNTYTNRSIIIKSFNEEAVDELGGIACGKLPAKQREGLTEEQLKGQKAIKCYRNVYGLASFPGVTADGDKVVVDNVPCLLRLSGDNFMDIGEAFDALAAKKVPMIQTELELTTERKSRGTNVWYHINVKWDVNKRLDVTDGDWEIFKTFQAAIDEENKQVIAKFNSAKNKQFDGQAVDIVAELDKDFGDDE